MIQSVFCRRLFGRAAHPLLASSHGSAPLEPTRSDRLTPSKRGKRPAGTGTQLAAESLEPRAMLAVTATLTGSNLVIALESASDTATLSSNGTTYTVSGTGLSATQFSAGSVAAVAVSGSAGAGQQFTLSGSGPLAADLSVDAAVESAAISTAVSGGSVSLLALATTLGSSVTTTGTQAYGGALTLASDATLTSNANLSFSSTVDGAKNLTLAAGAGAITFAQAVGGTNPLASLRINSAASATASAAVRLDGSASGASAYGLTIAPAAYNVSMRAAGSTIANYSGYGMLLYSTTTTKLLNFTVSNSGSCGIYATGVCTSTVVTGNTFQNNVVGAYLYAAQGIALTSGNQFLMNSPSSIGVYVSSQCTDSRVTGNSISGGGSFGVFLSDATGISIGGGTPAAANTISGVANGLFATGTLTGSSFAGNTVQNGSTGVYLYNTTGLTVGAGNQIKSNPLGLYASGSFSNTTVVGNTISAAFYGIYLLSAQGLTFNGGNQIQTSTYGLYATGTLTGTSFDDNTFSSNTNGLLLQDAKSLAFGTTTGNQVLSSSGCGLYALGDNSGTIVKANTFQSNAYGVVLYGARNTTVNGGNKIISNAAFGLYAGGNSLGTVVEGNQISGNGTNIDTSSATGGSFQST